MTEAERAVREAAANIPAEVCARFETADKLSDEDRKTIIDIARQALARFQAKPDTPAAARLGPEARARRGPGIRLKPAADARRRVMSDTTASLRRKIGSAGDLQSVVRTMKAMAASSIGQYEQSVRALADYYRTVELGLGVCFRKSAPAALVAEGTVRAERRPSAQSCSVRIRDWWGSSMRWWPISRCRRWPLFPANRGFGPSANACTLVCRTRDCRRPDCSACRIPSRPSPRWSGRF